MALTTDPAEPALDRAEPGSDPVDLHRQRWVRRLGAAAVVVAIVIIGWLFGGGKTSFDIDATADPDTTFDWSFFVALIPSFLKALWITVQATVAGIAVAVVFGLALALGRRSHVGIVRWPTWLFIEFVRSTPLLIQLYFLFYALPAIGWLPDSLRVLSPMVALITGLGIHYGTYCSEAYRAGIDSVPKGQWEAAVAGNLSSYVTWTRVILPQAIPNVLPALGNYLVAGFKDAPLGSTIQVTGVLFFATTVTAQTFRPVETYTLVGLGFLLVSIPAAFLIRRMEGHIGYDR